MNVVQVWLDRLQLISTSYTTFFAGMTGHTVLRDWPVPCQLYTDGPVVNKYECVNGKPPITSFTASFVLIRYRLIDMDVHYHLGGGPRPSSGTDRTAAPPSNPSSPLIAAEKSQAVRLERIESSPAEIQPSHSKSSTSGTGHGTANFSTIMNAAKHDFTDFLDHFQNVTGTKSEVENNNGTHLDPPIQLLSISHTLSVTMATLGFVLIALGILVFAWVTLPRAISIFSSVCLGGCLIAVFGVMVFC
ncbi:hypothetical protein BC629DRAFT_1515519 [Irpex lacteus]|nr:hypothetical protein BC629DRAFT_1515519 [Irpex lacteus]